MLFHFMLISSISFFTKHKTSVVFFIYDHILTMLCFSCYIFNFLLISNRAIKKMSAITSWENTKKASIEAQLKKIEVTKFISSLLSTFIIAHDQYIEYKG